MKPVDEIRRTLPQFTGTEQWHRYSPLFRNVLLTDGTKYLAEACEAYWLIDMIASHLPSVPKSEHWVVVTLLKYGQDAGLKGANFTLTDDVPAKQCYAHQQVEYTDFPLDEITLYAIHDGQYWVILLPSEY